MSDAPESRPSEHDPTPHFEDEDDPAVTLPGSVRRRFIGSIGIRATHALEDGLTLGVLFALSYASPEVLTVLTLAIFGSSIRKPKALLRRADAIVRTEGIQSQPAYFIVAFGLGALGVSVAGYVLRGPAALPVDPVALGDALRLAGV